VNEEDGPGWEMQDDNERRRWEEEQALNRCRRLTAELRAECRQFDDDMQQLRTRIESLQTGTRK
jgi:hypothetical protein